jgi:hypothetical protein
MLKEANVASDRIASNLTIVQGDITDIAAVRRTLERINGGCADVIMSGIGPSPEFSNFLSMIVGGMTLCGDAAETILAALDQIKPVDPPIFIAISTTGTSKISRDVPLAFLPMYHLALKVPHTDKRKMEDVIRTAGEGGQVKPVIIRPSLLTSGMSMGLENVREGWETENESHPAIGYTIARKDVGLWIFEKLITAPDRADRVGKAWSLTH